MSRFPIILFTLALNLLSIKAMAESDLNLPELGDSISGVVSLQQEYELGQTWLRMSRRQVPYYNDPQLEYYVGHLLARIAQYSDLTNKKLELLLIDNPTINAFAAPGGIIGVNSGLFLMANDEGELASVLAHELAHLSQRHWARSVAASKQNTLATVAGMLTGLILVATNNGQAGMAAITSTQAANLDSMLRFSRQNEQESDRIGMQTLIATGYNPADMTDMFENMLSSQRLQGNRPPEYLLSHPVTERRVADSRLRQPQQMALSYPDHPQYYFMRARVQLHYAETPQIAIKHFQSELDGRSLYPAASQYGLALAYQQSKQFSEAEKILAQLSLESPQEISFTMALADIALDKGDYTSAAAQLLSIREKAGNYFPAELLLAQTYVRLKKYDDAKKILQILSQQNPNEPSIWYELAEVSGLAKDIPTLHLARAQYFTLVGMFDLAKKQLTYALNLSKDNYVMTERIKQKQIELDKLEKDTLKL